MRDDKSKIILRDFNRHLWIADSINRPKNINKYTESVNIVIKLPSWQE